VGVISGIIRFVVFRVFGARVLLVLAVLGWLRDRVWRKPAVDDDARRVHGTPRRTG
jgi:hypothetical protein